MRHDVYTLAPDLATYTYGRVVLIGDAAHAMLPTMGQGANTSLEDGACVGLLIGRPVNQGTPLQGALHGFDAARRPRTQLIARRSRRSAVIGSHVRARPGRTAQHPAEGGTTRSGTESRGSLPVLARPGLIRDDTTSRVAAGQPRPTVTTTPTREGRGAPTRSGRSLSNRRPDWCPPRAGAHDGGVRAR
ncbi:hypothetical protein GM708_07105 [Vibrio cholerae]|nr:hypothetical protein [Vibrio cholerae]